MVISFQELSVNFPIHLPSNHCIDFFLQEDDKKEDRVCQPIIQWKNIFTVRQDGFLFRKKRKKEKSAAFFAHLSVFSWDFFCFGCENDSLCQDLIKETFRERNEKFEKEGKKPDSIN